MKFHQPTKKEYRVDKKDKHFLTVVLILAAGYIFLQMTADVAAAKIMNFFGLMVPGGTLVYAVTFTWRDLIHKKLGKRAAQVLIVTAGVTNVLMAVYFMFVVAQPPAPFWAFQEAAQTILGQVPRIVGASIVAEVVSELIDTEVYHLWVTRVTTRFQFLRVLTSNAISIPVDSFVFGFGAFYGIIPVAGIITMAWGQIVLKGAITLVSLPGIYLIKE